MPHRTDIHSILILGSGPIVIGQACEFDYSATQACRALKQSGYRVILMNSNPATIMTDPGLADATYIEPMRADYVEQIIAKERPDCILPTMGGQTALNLALELEQNGVLAKYNIELIGASINAIEVAENRALFAKAMSEIGLTTAVAKIVSSLEEATNALSTIGLPCIIRPSFTLGGAGGGIATTRSEFIQICMQGLERSPIHQIQMDQSLLGWKEYEMEVVRDKNDNCIIVCSIENFDPMGVHTGDSITVAPALTLTDREYQVMRTAAMAILRKIGVETGGSNVQFAVNPATGEQIVIEMNPRVSRSSALASKATGFPIARIAALLAVGYTLDELSNEISENQIPASFEPSIDYIVTKIPRFDFEKFKGTNTELTTSMKSVGEVIAFGRTFSESLQKAMRSLENGWWGFVEAEELQAIQDSAPTGDQSDSNNSDISAEIMKKIQHELAHPSSNRILYIGEALRRGMSVTDVHNITKIDPWFLSEIDRIIQTEESVKSLNSLAHIDAAQMNHIKSLGFADNRLAQLLHCDQKEVREYRHQLGVRPVYKRVDTCAAEFSTSTNFFYSTYEAMASESEVPVHAEGYNPLIILGGGPNRIGQGIEFDYCCVHACGAARKQKRDVIMINCNPETVSTDYDVSDMLCMEPVTVEDTLELAHALNAQEFVPQFGGQTPLKICAKLEDGGMRVVGTSTAAIARAEDRDQFRDLVQKLHLLQPANATATTMQDAVAAAQTIGFPLVVRPSFVLGGRAMEIVYEEPELHNYLKEAFRVSASQPILLDRYLDGAIEVDVEAISDGKNVIIAAILEHIEEAGIHSGDSACTLPAFSLSEEIKSLIQTQTKMIALELGVKGLMNIQFAVGSDQQLYLIEVNPRASRTVPFVGKCTGESLPQIALYCALGRSLPEQGITENLTPKTFAVKEAVFPFDRFPETDQYLGPEMRSTGEVMGHDSNPIVAYYKSQIHNAVGLLTKADTESSPGAQVKPMGALLSVRRSDQKGIAQVAHSLVAAGYTLYATEGTANAIKATNCEVVTIKKLQEGTPNAVDLLEAGSISLVINTCQGRQAIIDSAHIRQTALRYGVYTTTTLRAAQQISRVLQLPPQELKGDVVSLQTLLGHVENPFLTENS